MLEKLADEITWTEDPDFNPYEFSGGNYDDAYFAGVADGKVKLAREILEAIKSGN